MTTTLATPIVTDHPVGLALGVFCAPKRPTPRDAAQGVEVAHQPTRKPIVNTTNYTRNDTIRNLATGTPFHQAEAEPILMALFDGLTLPTLLRIAALGDGTDPDPAPSAVEPRQMTELAL